MNPPLDPRPDVVAIAGPNGARETLATAGVVQYRNNCHIISVLQPSICGDFAHVAHFRHPLQTTGDPLTISEYRDGGSGP